jgi:hypothetical protein
MTMSVIGTLRKLGGCAGGIAIYDATKAAAAAANSIPGDYREFHSLRPETKRRLRFLFPELNFDKVEFRRNCTLPPGWFGDNVDAMTFGYTIYFRIGNIQGTEAGLRLLIHELVHVDQVRRRGDSETKFACDYGVGYLSAGDYENNPLEREARDKLPADAPLPPLPEQLTQYLFVTMPSGDVANYYWSPQPGWRADPVSARAGARADFRVVGKLATTRSDYWPTPNVYGRSAGGHVIGFYWSPQGVWAAADITQATVEAYCIASDPVVDSFLSGPTPTQHVFGRNANGDLIHYYWSSQPGWGAENLTQYQKIGAAFRIASDPVVDSFLSGPTPTQHVFGRNANGDLIHYYWSPQPDWGAENLTLYQKIGAAFRLGPAALTSPILVSLPY